MFALGIIEKGSGWPPGQAVGCTIALRETLSHGNGPRCYPNSPYPHFRLQEIRRHVWLAGSVLQVKAGVFALCKSLEARTTQAREMLQSQAIIPPYNLTLKGDMLRVGHFHRQVTDARALVVGRVALCRQTAGTQKPFMAEHPHHIHLQILGDGSLTAIYLRSTASWTSRIFLCSEILILIFSVVA